MKAQKTILIVEDTTENIDILVAVLSPHYQLRVAKNGQQALQVATKNPPDLILLDVLMPVMDGHETCQALKAKETTQDIPVIFLTAQSETKDLIRGFDLGAVDYITKPFNMRELLARVNTHLQLREALENLQATQDKLSAHNQKMQEDLELATLFQQELLPEIQEIPFLEIACKYRPYSEVSGDTYSTSISHENSTFNIFLGDATGHGVAATFMTMLVQASLDHLDPKRLPDEILRELNTFLSAKEKKKWMTGLYLRIQKEGQMQTATAGHPPLILLPASGEAPLLFEKGGCPLGIFPEEPIPYVTENYVLQHNDHIFIYTDGLTEWRNAADKMFGTEALVQFLSRQRMSSPENLLTQLYEHLEHHAQGVPCGDDFTAVSIRFQKI